MKTIPGALSAWLVQRLSALYMLLFLLYALAAWLLARPATLLQALRFIADSRDGATAERLEQLNDAYRLFRCRSIMNCTEVCPKHLNPNRAIERIKERMVKAEL